MKTVGILTLLVSVFITSELSAQLNQDAGTILLQDSTTLLKESVVTAERLKGKSENGKTIFFMNNTILSASGSAPDVLRHIPGIQVDMKHNITLEGSSKILLFVNGKERDKSFISQLNPSQIDKVEILNVPPSNYDGSVTGVINIVLKKDVETGFSGRFFTEIPTSNQIVYSFPAAGIQYGSEKLTIYASYSGEINLENIDETHRWQTRGAAPEINISWTEMVRQNNLSHKIHYGLDYQVTPGDVLSYYGSVNPYSYEQNGIVKSDFNGDADNTGLIKREERDKNLNIFNSFYYKHTFKKPGRELSAELSNSILRSDNSVSYTDNSNSDNLPVVNSEKPEQLSSSIKIDFSNPIGENIMVNTGLRAGVNSMQNETASGFEYKEHLYALYGTFSYKRSKSNLSFGLRAEYSESALKNSFDKGRVSLLPYMTFQYKLNSRHNLLFAYRRSVNRPSVFQLNPYTYADNRFFVRKGNPLLEPEYRNMIYAGHSIRLGVSYISYRVFYESAGNVINPLTVLKNGESFETRLQNLGEIHQAGMQFSGSLKFGPVTISTSARLFSQFTTAGNLAKQYKIQNRQNLAFDAGITSVISFKHDFALSGTIQYSTTKINIQENTRAEALYIFSLDKTFKSNIKLGVMTALPFAGTFVYQQSEIEADNFSGSYSGNLKLPEFPVMFRLSYQFKTGQDKILIHRERDEAPRRKKSGF